MVRRELHAGKSPPGQVCLRIGEKPALKIHRLSAAVVQLDPIGTVAILVSDCAGIGRNELGDQHLAIGVCRQQCSADPPEPAVEAKRHAYGGKGIAWWAFFNCLSANSMSLRAS